jgi:hypothetical protein
MAAGASALANHRGILGTSTATGGEQMKIAVCTNNEILEQYFEYELEKLACSSDREDVIESAFESFQKWAIDFNVEVEHNSDFQAWRGGVFSDKRHYQNGAHVVVGRDNESTPAIVARAENILAVLVEHHVDRLNREAASA